MEAPSGITRAEAEKIVFEKIGGGTLTNILPPNGYIQLLGKQKADGSLTHNVPGDGLLQRFLADDPIDRDGDGQVSLLEREEAKSIDYGTLLNALAVKTLVDEAIKDKVGFQKKYGDYISHEKKSELLTNLKRQYPNQASIVGVLAPAQEVSVDRVLPAIGNESVTAAYKKYYGSDSKTDFSQIPAASGDTAQLEHADAYAAAMTVSSLRSNPSLIVSDEFTKHRAHFVQQANEARNNTNDGGATGISVARQLMAEASARLNPAQPPVLAAGATAPAAGAQVPAVGAPAPTPAVIAGETISENNGYRVIQQDDGKVVIQKASDNSVLQTFEDKKAFDAFVANQNNPSQIVISSDAAPSPLNTRTPEAIDKLVAGANPNNSSLIPVASQGDKGSPAIPSVVAPPIAAASKGATSPNAKTPAAVAPAQAAPTPTPASPAAAAPAEVASPSDTGKYTVQSGDSLGKLLKDHYAGMPHHGFTYLALKLAIEQANQGKQIFLGDGLGLRADAGEIALPTPEQVKSAFANGGVTYEGAAQQIKGDLSGQLIPPNYSGPLASQQKLEGAGLAFKKLEGAGLAFK